MRPKRLYLIGYSVNTTFGTPGTAGTYPYPSGPNLNYYDYGGTSACPGFGVAGINDGISVTPGTPPRYILTTSGAPIEINLHVAPLYALPLLSNDYGADGFKCLEVVPGSSGSVLPGTGNNSTHVTYAPAPGASGVQLLRYIPYNTTTGAEGNVTYVYVYVEDETDCIATPCDLVANGGFENVNAASDWGVYVSGRTYCWNDFNGTPDLYATDAPPSSGRFYVPPANMHPGSTSSNIHEVLLADEPMGSPPWGAESIDEQLSSSILPGTTYTISFWAQTIGSFPTHLVFAAGNTFPMFGSVTPVSSLSSLYGLVPLDEFLITPSWHQYTATISGPSAPESVLVVSTAPWDDGLTTPPGYEGDEVIIDDMSIVPTASACTITLPATMCNSDGDIDLTTTVSVGGGTFTWVTSSAMITTHSTTFDPGGAYAASIAGGYGGMATIRYDYTNSLGCTQTVYGTISIYPPPTAITGPTTVCVGGTITLSDAVAGGAWSSSATAIASVDATGTVYGVAAGDAIITYSFSSTCSVSLPVTVITGTIPGIITASPSLSICLGGTTLLSAATPGCTWSSSNTTVAPFTAGTGGATVMGATAGTATLTATYAASGCSSAVTVTVGSPTAYSLIGGGPYCIGGAGVYIGLSSSEWWVSYQLLLDGVPIGAPVAGTGTFFDFGEETAAGAYTVVATNILTGCSTPMTGASVVSIAAYPGIFTMYGGGSRCSAGPGLYFYTTGSQTGITYQLYNGSTPVGTAIAGTGGGLVFGPETTAGTYTVIATNPLGPCNTVLTGSATITVSLSPDAITGTATSICYPGTISLSDASGGGTWSSSNTYAAVVASAGSPSGGVVTGVGSGTTTIAYTVADGCAATVVINVNLAPLPLTGTTAVCYPGTTALADAVGGGTWSSSTTGVAVVDGSGIVTGVAPGTTTISYVLPWGCSTSTVVTVYLQPGAISGSNILCTGSTITLSDATPSGTWSSGSTAVAGVSAGAGAVTGVGAGTATITYTTGGGCIATSVITVYSSTAACSPCHMLDGGGFSLLGAGGTISADVTAGNYYIAGDVTVTSSVTMTDAVIFVAPYAHIYVAASAGLTLDGCHLFSCAGNMWDGIVLLSDGTQTATIALQAGSNSTLIEDALIGVDVESPIAPTGGAANFVVSGNTVFNRDQMGIQITNYIAPDPTTASPLDLQNTVFTSRNLCDGDPFAWPGAVTLKADVSVPSPYFAPFNVTTYDYEACHIPAPEVGLYLQNIGTSAYYSQVVAGAPDASDPRLFGSINYQQNLFDTLIYGIRAINTNLTSINNAFAHMSLRGEAGICATVTNHAPYTLTVQAGVYTYGRGGIYGSYTNISPNYFYNCYNGVYAGSYSYVTGTGSYMITNQTNANCCPTSSSWAFVGSGFYGYNIISGQNYKTVIDDNTIINIDNGIAMEVPGRPATISSWYRAPAPSQIMIDSNTIEARPAGVTTLGNAYVQKPIWVDIPIAYLLFGSPPVTAQVNMDNNIITDAYNGIYVNGAASQVATSNSNNINEVEYPSGGTKGVPQFGIYHGNCVNDQVLQNNITGTDYTDLTWEGVQLMHGVTHRVNCNNVSTMGIGFEFNGVGVSSTWTSNNMTNNSRGFVLGGIIGPQGDATHLCYNSWLTSGGFTWTGTNYQTVTENGISPASSPLYLIAGTTDDPVNNNTISFPDLCGEKYGCIGGSVTGSGNGLNVLGGTDWTVDMACGGINFIRIDMLEHMVQQDLPYSTYPNLNYWMGQYAVWEALQQNDSLADSSAILIAFELMANNSRFALFTNLEDTLAMGDAADAQIMLDAYSIDSMNNNQYDSSTGVQMADDTTADDIVLNYREFYQLYINYLDTAMTSSDSAAVAAMSLLCPITNGTVVYKARALYDIIYDTLVLFPSTCSDSVVFDSSAMRHSAPSLSKEVRADTTQKYALYPNPNSGNFVLQQGVTDSRPVQVDIWDAIGQSIYKEQVQFLTKTVNLQIGNVAPGFYMLQVRNSEGRMFKFKFVVE